MKIKLMLFILGVLLAGSIDLKAQHDKIIKSEAKFYCQCYDSFEKEKKVFEKKTKRKEKREAKPKKYREGMKLFGGYSLDFSYAVCLDNKRSQDSRDYIDALDDKEKEEFRRQVKKMIDLKCSMYNSNNY